MANRVKNWREIVKLMSEGDKMDFMSAFKTLTKPRTDALRFDSSPIKPVSKATSALKSEHPVPPPTLHGRNQPQKNYLDIGYSDDVGDFSNNLNEEIERLQQKDDMYDQHFQRYEKYLNPISPRYSGKQTYTEDLDQSSSAHIDELLSQFRREMNTMSSQVDNSLNDSELRDRRKEVSFSTKIGLQLSPSHRSNDDPSYTFDHYLDEVDLKRIDNEYDDSLLEDTHKLKPRTLSAKKKPKPGLFSLAPHFDRVEDDKHLQDNPKTPKKSANAEHLVSPSPFTRLKTTSAKDFSNSPLAPPKLDQDLIDTSALQNTSVISTGKGQQAYFSKVEDERDDEPVEKSKSLLDSKLFQPLPLKKHLIQNGLPDSGLRIENIELRNEVNKLQATIALLQTRMEGMEKNMEYILRLLTSGQQ